MRLFKTKPRRSPYDEYRVKRFAWLPTHVEDQWIWFEHYETVEWVGVIHWCVFEEKHKRKLIAR
jgi:hypothetical protein